MSKPHVSDDTWGQIFKMAQNSLAIRCTCVRWDKIADNSQLAAQTVINFYDTIPRLKWAADHNYKITESTIDLFCLLKNSEIVLHLLKKNNQMLTPNQIKYVTISGNLELLEQLDFTCAGLNTIARTAADHGHIHIFNRFKHTRFIHSVHDEIVVLVVHAAKNSVLDNLISYKEKHGYIADRSNLKLALLHAPQNDLTVVKWLLENDAGELNVDAFAAATRHSIQVLEWLESLKCPMDSSDIFKTAAECASLDVLKWLKRNGCPRDRHAYYEAIARGDIDILEWFYEIGCTGDVNVFEYGIKSKKLEVMDWLYDKMPQFYHGSHLANIAIGHNSIDMLKWLYAHGINLTTQLFTSAINLQKYEIAKWLRNPGDGSPGCSWSLADLQICKLTPEIIELLGGVQVVFGTKHYYEI